MSEIASTTETLTVGSDDGAQRPRKRALKNLMKREGIWYFHKIVNGKREFGGRKTPFSLDTRDLEVAKTRRDAILRAASGAEVSRILGQRVGPMPATLGQVLEAYAAADHPRELTRTHNAAALKLVIRKARGLTNEQIAALSVTELSGSLVHDFQDAVVKAARAEGIEDGSEAMMRTKYSANRQLAQARSVFANEKPFRKLHLPIEPSWADADDFQGLRLDHSFTPMTQAETDLFAAKSKEIKVTQPGVYATYLLMQWCGFRNEEVEHCIPSEWLTKTGPTSYVLDVRPRPYFLPKGTPGKVPVPLWLANEILELAGAGDWLDEEERERGTRWLLRERTATGRYNVTHRAINEWMAEVYREAIAEKVLPPGTAIRTSYDFRRQAGSILYEQTHDILAVQRFLRHESPATTTKWYANLIKELPAISELRGR